MDINNHIKTVFLALLIVCVTACEEMILGPQPNFLEKPEHIPMLNIMGVLRPDSLQTYPMSFIQLEKSVTVPYDTSESEDVPSALVAVYRMENNQPVDTILFYPSRFEGVFDDSVFRSPKFFPRAGETYQVLCKYNDLPALTSQTTIPEVPLLAGDSLNVLSESIHFTILYDSSVTLYDVALLLNNELFNFFRFYRKEEGNLDVSLSIESLAFFPTDTIELIIYAYDEKLTDYITTSPSAIWPNTYQPAYSTVTNGYGCFGSLNLVRRKINFFAL